jgi:transcriptional regulator with XRE-family HTH domain
VKSDAAEIGKRLRRRREALGMTRAALAQRCGLSEDALGLIERGTCSPRVENLLRLSDALRVTPSAILEGRATKGGNVSIALDRLVSYLDDRPEADVQMVHDIARGVLERKRKRRR